MNRSRFVVSFTRGLALVLLVGGSGLVLAYNQYSTNQADNCAACHGDFRASGYVSVRDGVAWPDTLMGTHSDMVTGECDICHSGGPRFPVLLGSSRGGFAQPAIGCVGCHGRAEDGSGTGSQGYGVGLRQHHFNAGAATCDGIGCHADSDPANVTPVAESIVPPYYGDTVNYPFIPTDPCNPAPVFNENYAGTTIGLDNDGDGNYDEADTDCGAVAGTPGEVSDPTSAPLLVTDHDSVLGALTLSYASACDTNDSTLEYGDLVDVATYGYSGQECGLGTTGNFVWTYPGSPSSVFFLVVGNNGLVEGSYGRDSMDIERPEDTISAACAVPQDLSMRCD